MAGWNDLFCRRVPEGAFYRHPWIVLSCLDCVRGCRNYSGSRGETNSHPNEIRNGSRTTGARIPLPCGFGCVFNLVTLFQVESHEDE